MFLPGVEIFWNAAADGDSEDMARIWHMEEERDPLFAVRVVGVPPSTECVAPKTHVARPWQVSGSCLISICLFINWSMYVSLNSCSFFFIVQHHDGEIVFPPSPSWRHRYQSTYAYQVALMIVAKEEISENLKLAALITSGPCLFRRIESCNQRSPVRYSRHPRLAAATLKRNHRASPESSFLGSSST